MGEWFGRKEIKPASPKEREITETAYAAADPTAYSQLPLTETPEVIGHEPGKGLPQVRSAGEEYIKLREVTNPALQQAIARMLKGIINVSDVVKDVSSEKGAYYSSIMPIERVVRETPVAEVTADGYVMEQAFGDWDHMEGLTEAKPWISNARYEDGKVSHFDFGEARHVVHGGVADGPAKSAEKIVEPNAIRIALDKLALLKKRLSGDGGYKFMRAIFGPDEQTIETLHYVVGYEAKSMSAKKQIKYLQDLYLNRIQRAEAALFARLEELEPARKAA